MVILGLTGSIGMGKSKAAAALEHLGVPAHDADYAVHRLLRPGGGAVQPVAHAFPEAVRAEARSGRRYIDRRVLGKLVFDDDNALKRLEGILHPLVRESERRFLARQSRRRAPVVALDIPLLFETGAQRRCDAVLALSAPAFVQRQRVLTRTGMTAERFAKIQRHQLSDSEKRRRADFVVRTGLSRALTLRQLRRIVGKMKTQRARHWPPYRRPPFAPVAKPAWRRRLSARERNA